MKSCLSIKTDYSLFKSIIKIPDLISYALKNNYHALGLIDDNLFSSIEFIKNAKLNNIKPIIGFNTTINDMPIILYAKDYQGLVALFKISAYILDNDLTTIELIKYLTNLVIVLPHESISLYDKLNKIHNDIFIGYSSDKEKQEALILTNKIITFKNVLALTVKSSKYLNYLNMINENLTINEYQNIDYSCNVIYDNDENNNLIKLINDYEFPRNQLIPHYDKNIENSDKYLEMLAIKGLKKRLNNNISDIYKKRLIYELNVIKKLNFVDYFLIVYDYVKYAKNNNIMVGPGRGSAVGSLVTYSLGITNIDPLKYNLLFERFLNSERISMPDIDIDFDSERRQEVIDYVKSRYGEKNVLSIMTFGTMAPKQIVLSLGKILNIDTKELSRNLNSNKTLKENLTKDVIKILNDDAELKSLYYDAFYLEGIKKHISTHAAGVIISNISLENIIPIAKSADNYITGYTMYYLEELGLLKMDFLGIKDLNIIDKIINSLDEELNINTINLDDELVYEKFSESLCAGIFQFESEGMRKFLRLLKPKCFNDLVLAIALYRPGPMKNIESFIKRREGKENITYITDKLKKSLESTYGIIVYQEQIIQILTDIASYTMAEADLIRRAISKKDEKIMLNEKNNFIEKAIKNNHLEYDASEIFDLIIKFANYGFNKSHAVAYAVIAYQMMYLKVNYPKNFYPKILDANIGSVSKIKEFITESLLFGFKILKPDINSSIKEFYYDEGLRMPFGTIKNMNENFINKIISNRTEFGEYLDFYDLVSRIYSNDINESLIKLLIDSGCLDSFNETRKTLTENIKNAIIYAELINGLDKTLVAKPVLEEFSEYPINELMNKEYELYGFYISNHPASKYKLNKHIDINKYFDKVINTVGLLENIKVIKTKTEKEMAFLILSDETGSLDYVLFPNKMNYALNLKRGDLLSITGKVEKRLDKYQIVINKLEVVNEE